MTSKLVQLRLGAAVSNLVQRWLIVAGQLPMLNEGEQSDQPAACQSKSRPSWSAAAIGEIRSGSSVVGIKSCGMRIGSSYTGSSQAQYA